MRFDPTRGNAIRYFKKYFSFLNTVIVFFALFSKAILTQTIQIHLQEHKQRHNTPLPPYPQVFFILLPKMWESRDQPLPGSFPFRPRKDPGNEVGFASVRGCPQFMYSDPGSQLIGAEKELRNAWQNMDEDELRKKGMQNGMNWIFGPADSPWYQEAVESLIKIAKRAIIFAVGKRRLSVPEFLTVCTEVANINERPIGTLPSTDFDLSMLTPNSLLLGRATSKNSGMWQLYTRGQNPKNRYHLVQSTIDNFWEK